MAMAEQSKTKSLAEKLCCDVRELSLGTGGEIERVEGAPSPLRFLRDFVLPNKPCIITHAIDHWPALTAWTNSYLISSLANQQVSVHITPDGYADALVDLNRISSVYGCTVKPEQITLTDNTRAFTYHSGCIESDRDGYTLRPKHMLIDTLADSDDDCCIRAHETGSLHSRLSRSCNKVPQGNDPAVEGHGNHASVYPRNDDDDPLVRENWHIQEHLVRDHAEPVESPGERRADGIGHARATDRGDVNHSTQTNGLIGMPLSYVQQTPSTDTVRTSGSTDNNSLSETPCCTTTSMAQLNETRLRETWFVTAHVERLLFPKALELILCSGIENGIAYAQEQNGCFLSEYGALAADVETHLPWATDALGCLPEAVNLWIGNEKAVTSFHKDHYENLYAVIAGEKHFTLLPPTDVHRLHIQNYPAAHYVKHEGKFLVEQEEPARLVPWISIDPYPPSEAVSCASSEFPDYFSGPEPFTCTLQAGEILYLPSMWFHHVRQSPDPEGRTIALNFWYDMQFDIKYAYFNFLESLMLNT